MSPGNCLAKIRRFFSARWPSAWIAVVYLVAGFTLPAYGQVPTSWKSIESRHIKVLYGDIADLENLERRIDYSPEASFLGGLFRFSGSDNPAKAVKDKMDSLYERVQEILGMRKRIKKVTVKILPNTEAIRELLVRNFRIEHAVRAWYVFELNTIFVNAKDINEGVLAHEMAHAIIDNYLTVRPPRETAEILARYVDQHLYY